MVDGTVVPTRGDDGKCPLILTSATAAGNGALARCRMMVPQPASSPPPANHPVQCRGAARGRHQQEGRPNYLAPTPRTPVASWHST